MSDRKESLLRTLKLQNEQLEQWEHLRLISRDPDEQLRCDSKIADIKALIIQNETELKKLKGSKSGKETESSVSVTNQGASHLQHNHIGFDLSKNKLNNTEPHDEPVNDVGDITIGNKQYEAANETNTSIHIAGSNRDEDTSYKAEVKSKKRRSPTEKKENKKRDIFLAFIFGAISMIILFSSLIGPEWTIKLSENRALIKIITFVLSLIGIGLTYFYNPISFYLNRGLKFGISILILAVYAAVLFWERKIFTEHDDNGNLISAGKPIGEVVVLPLIIVVVGSIILLVNEENKRKKN